MSQKNVVPKKNLVTKFLVTKNCHKKIVNCSHKNFLVKKKFSHKKNLVKKILITKKSSHR